MNIFCLSFFSLCLLLLTKWRYIQYSPEMPYIWRARCIRAAFGRSCLTSKESLGWQCESHPFCICFIIIITTFDGIPSERNSICSTNAGRRLALPCCLLSLSLPPFLLARSSSAWTCTRFVLLTRFRPRSNLLARAHRLYKRVPIAIRVISKSFHVAGGIDRSCSTKKSKFVSKNPHQQKKLN